MDRKLKERLIGAAVLVAVAVIMVPEMFSGSHSSHDNADNSSSGSSSGSVANNDPGQIKTYRIDLQKHQEVAASSQDSVSAQAMPMVPDTRADAAISASMPPVAVTSSASSSVNQPITQSATQSSGAPSPHNAGVSHPAVAHSSANSVSAPRTVTASAATGWSIQLGSFSAESSAREIVSSAKSHGFAAYLASVKISGKTLYRVRVGPFADRDVAEATLGKLKHGYSQASLVAPNH